MTVTIAVAGKGGTGKTTFTALTIRYLLDMGRRPILAVDGDPSSNLHSALGLPLYQTVGQIREETRDQVTTGTFQAGISKPEWFELQVNECLVESQDIDLLAMGRAEGPGCYCAANNILRDCVDRLASDYPYVVIDNEAGMEHISRQTTRDVDHLFIVSDPSRRGLEAAERIVELVADLGNRIAKSYLVINNVVGELPASFVAAIEALDVTFLGTLPHDSQVSELDLLGEPLVQLAEVQDEDGEAHIYPRLKALLAKVL
jgi:CO dehydrogenase maturation factor